MNFNEYGIDARKITLYLLKSRHYHINMPVELKQSLLLANHLQSLKKHFYDYKFKI